VAEAISYYFANMRASEGQTPASKSRAQAGEGWVRGKVPAADEAMIRILPAFRKSWH